MNGSKLKQGGRGRGRASPRNGNQFRKTFDNEEKSGWGSHREVTYQRDQDEVGDEYSDKPSWNNNDSRRGGGMFSQRVRGGFNQNSNRRAYLEAKEGSDYLPAAGRGRGSSKFNSSWKDDVDKENFDQSNFNEGQAKSGSGRGRGSARLAYKNDQMQKPYGFNRDQQSSSSAFDENKPVKSFNEALIKNMGRGRGGRDSDTGRGRGRGNRPPFAEISQLSRGQQQDTDQGWPDNEEQTELDPHHSETVPIPEEEECQEQPSHCSDAFEDCVIHPYDPASPLEDQKDG